jgi:hypothetical protein
MRDEKEESLLEVKSEQDEILELKIDIVKHIFKELLMEQEERKDKLVKAEKKQRLLNIIEEKQEESLKSKSIEELTKLVDEL